MKAILQLRGISKTFITSHGSHNLFKKLSLSINPGEFVSVIGPNGSGKTTLLKIISGLIQPDSGKVEVKKGIKFGFVFQDYRQALFPWLNVKDNVGLYYKFHPHKNWESIVDHFLQKSGLASIKDRYPHQLSGGQAQLTAICRSMVYGPDILLFDEPFSSLDYNHITKMEELVIKLCRSTQKTVIFISHDINEAILLSDRVLVLSKKMKTFSHDVRIELPIDRELGQMHSPEFMAIRKELHEYYMEAI